MGVSDRLAEYGPFSQEVIDTVTTVAELQASYESYQDFFESAGVKDTVKLQYDGYLPTEILDIRPTDCDLSEVIVYDLPLANPLDPNQIYQVATIAATNPNKRVIASSNPSGSSYNYGLLISPQRKTVVGNNLRPVVDPLLRYIDEQGIEVVRHAGYSYGADKAVAAATHGDYESDRAVLIEPASVVKRSLGGLASAFGESDKAVSTYVGATGLETFKDAREASVGKISYVLGLARVTNLAIARFIAHGEFEEHMGQALEAQPNMKTSLVWGSESELALDGVMRALASNLREQTGGRVRPMRLRGQKHALGNDIHLHAALVLEGFK